jgi:regulatory protein
LIGSAPEAKRYSLKLLAYRGRSEQELRERLDRKGFEEDIIESVTRDLKKAGFIDDAQLAINLKRQAQEGRLLGYHAVRLFLLKRGLSRDVVDAVLAYDQEEELHVLQRLLEKKMRLTDDRQTPAGRQRLWNFLIRRGYSTDIIRRAMKDIDLDEEAL